MPRRHVPEVAGRIRSTLPPILIRRPWRHAVGPAGNGMLSHRPSTTACAVLSVWFSGPRRSARKSPAMLSAIAKARPCAGSRLWSPPSSAVIQAPPPPRPAPRGVPAGACHTTDGASRVATVPLFHAYRRQYPGGDDRCARRSLPGRWQPSPLFGRVGLRIARFEACSTFTRVAARMVAEPPRAARCTGVLQPKSLPPSTAPIATGWSGTCRAGFAPAGRQHLSTAHRIKRDRHLCRTSLWSPTIPTCRRGLLRAILSQQGSTMNGPPLHIVVLSLPKQLRAPTETSLNVTGNTPM